MPTSASQQQSSTVSRRLLADKAYDANHLRHPLQALGTEMVIPSNSTRRHSYPLDRIAYRGSNVIERMFCRMKDWRGIATRYNRLARNFLPAIALVAPSILADLIESAT